jgi:hypothetical protein
LGVVVDDDALGSQVLNALSVEVVDLDDVVGVEVVVVVLLGDDALGVQVVAVDGGDDGLVVLMVDVVLDDEGLAGGIVLSLVLVLDDVVILDPS